MKERVSRLTEGVEIIRRLWTDDRVVHRGRHWQLDGVSIRPRPLQRPRPPVLVGSQVPAGIARAARIADGWLVVPIPTVDEFAKEAGAFAAAPEEQLRRLAADRFAVGSPAQVVDALLRQHRAGVTHATMRVSWPGMKQADVLAGIELLGRAVLPEVRRLTSARGE